MKDDSICSGPFSGGGGGINTFKWSIDPSPTPQALGKITVRTVQVVRGWIAQIVIDGTPVWESPAYPEGDDYEDPRASADRCARIHMAERLARIFA